MRYSREDACRAWMTYGALNPDSLEELLAEYGSYEAIYEQFQATQGEILLHYANNQQMESLTHQAAREEMHHMLVGMQHDGIGIIAKEDYAYPEMLRHIHDAPPLLYYKGNLQALRREKYITMVGSRNASRASLEATRTIARDLSRSGVCIVSGLAVGVDAAAHEGCLEGSSPTVGVAACGLDMNYPAENALLKRKILERGGILLSEAPLGTSALAWRFPVRNRILAGLSTASLLMEARTQSGSMSTIDHALSQGREVYAYSVSPDRPHSEAARDLMRDGSKCFADAQTVLDYLGWSTRKTSSELRETPPDLSMLDETQADIYQLLTGGEQSYDQLAAATGLGAQELSGALTMLQIYGLIRALPGKMYKKS